MRFLARFMFACAILAGFAGIADAQILETGKSRPGKDFSSVVGTPNAAQCGNLCAGQAACKAWTWVKPGVLGPQPVCYLKNGVPTRVDSACCTSGVKLTGPTPPGAFAGVNLPGADYNDFDLPAANPKLCSDNCAGDPACQAWTYVNPGIQGAQARCYLKNAIPAQVANSCCISGVKLPPPPPPLPPGAQFNKDRPGGDYSDFDLPAANPTLCFNSCQADGACLAWTYAKPGAVGPSPHCYLKNPAPAAVDNPCCISGAKAAPPPPLPPGAQANKNRPGGDYSDFGLPAANPTLCFNACQADGSCLAWTYTKPGVVGPSARCYLKNPVPAPVNNPCCVSGVKAAPPPPPPPVGGAPFEVNINRPGGDYIDFASGGAHTALLCLAACQSQPACKAWTYVKPGIQGPQSHCWLKTIVPPAQVNNCCVSGVK